MDIITLEKKVLIKNDIIAEENKALFHENKVYALNILSSPGSGKTSILERTLDKLSDSINISVIVGDIQTANDAERLDKFKASVVQLITNGTCHLSSKMIRDALNKLNLKETDLLLIENVGNLVCPSGFDLGEEKRVVIFSTTEGTDKPLKYPGMFYKADLVIINKMDLVPYTDFNVESAIKNVQTLNPGAIIIKTSCVTGEGIDSWRKWLTRQI